MATHRGHKATSGSIPMAACFSRGWKSFSSRAKHNILFITPLK